MGVVVRVRVRVVWRRRVVARRVGARDGAMV